MRMPFRVAAGVGLSALLLGAIPGSTAAYDCTADIQRVARPEQAQGFTFVGVLRRSWTAADPAVDGPVTDRHAGALSADGRV